MKEKLRFRLGGLLLLLAALPACGATAVIPQDAATGETASASSRMSYILPEEDIPADVWPVLSVLQQTAETSIWLPFGAQLEVENIDQNPELPNGSWPYSNSHCLVLTGYDTETCYLADPMQEISEVDRDRFALSYEERGSYAVVIAEE